MSQATSKKGFGFYAVLLAAVAAVAERGGLWYNSRHLKRWSPRAPPARSRSQTDAKESPAQNDGPYAAMHCPPRGRDEVARTFFEGLESRTRGSPPLE